MTLSSAAPILIPQGTIVGYSFRKADGRELVSGTLALAGDAYVNATRQEDGCWAYGLSDRRTYYCAGGLATVLSSPEPDPSPAAALARCGFRSFP